MPTPNACPAPTSLPTVRMVGLTRPLHWLRLGWRDLWRAGTISFVQGAALTAAGALLLLIAHDRFWLLASAASGFLVVAPLFATGFYALSRALERGEPADGRLLVATWTAWQQQRSGGSGGYWCLVRFGLLLALAGTGWVLTSAALITLYAPAPVQTPVDFLRSVVLAEDSWLFELWLLLGGLLAAPIYASSVVSMPLLLDRAVSVQQAVLTSWAVIVTNPLPMALWAGLLMVITALGMLSGIGLIVALPLLGHASWHAYRELVDASHLPERLPPSQRAA
ncbi:putative membrane protein [Tibeticola sediminis]|uniref:Putative membrane protein n=1 Tax=Tibeticola sediminis TaxID=1917811 RepID=A0A3N4V1R3_9BURK|nr:DUF2189 domain-containing protein [Tibeticola sediminis]RPE66854.1 putative membrane protein [Tibeticola sediminis]